MFLSGMVLGQEHIINDLFSPIANSSALNSKYEKATILNINRAVLQSVRTEAPEALNISIPIQDGSSLELELFKAKIFSDNFELTLSSGSDFEGDLGIHYRGKIKGNPGSTAIISIFNDELAGVVSSMAGNYNLGKLKSSDEYIYIHDKDINTTNKKDWICGVDDSTVSIDWPRDEGAQSRNNETLLIYVEGDYDLVAAVGSLSNATSYLSAVLAQGIILFNNDGVDAQISGLKVWDTPSPYVPGNDDYPATGYLESFGYYLTNFNGHLALLLTSQNIGGGLAATIGGLCHPNMALRMCTTNLQGDLVEVPAYSWDGSVWVHEIGHLLGSRHTHACVWNGNNTQIDDCASYYYYYEGGYSINDLEGGNCFDPNNPVLPANGGFIMSYCDFLQNVGTNLSLGFGDQSGAVIRQTIASAPCLSDSGSGILAVVPNPIVFSSSEDCLDIKIIAEGDWFIDFSEDYPPYFLSSIYPTEGSGDATVTLCVSENEFPEDRGFPLFLVNSSSDYVIIEVYQEGVKIPTAFFYPADKAIVKYEGDIIGTNIVTNTDWKLIQNDYDNWVEIKSIKSGTKNGPFSIEVLANNTGLNRFAKIGLVYNNALDTSYFTVSQPAKDAGYLNVPPTLKVGAFEYEYQIPVFSDLEWEITDISSGWIESNIKKGKNNGSVVLTIRENADANERTATIYFSGKLGEKTIEKSIKINQVSFRSNSDVVDFLIYPNPTRDDLKVAINSKSQTDIQITLQTMNGELVKMLEDSKNVLGNNTKIYDVSDIPTGIYTMITRLNDQIRRDKIIIIR